MAAVAAVAAVAATATRIGALPRSDHRLGLVVVPLAVGSEGLAVVPSRCLVLPSMLVLPSAVQKDRSRPRSALQP
jgi:hypothetical protein